MSPSQTTEEIFNLYNSVSGFPKTLTKEIIIRAPLLSTNRNLKELADMNNSLVLQLKVLLSPSYPGLRITEDGSQIFYQLGDSN